MAKIQREVFVPESLAYKRLDHIAAILLPEYSRNRIQFWIKSGALIVNEQSRRASDKLIGGERICLDVTLENLEAQPEEIDLEIVYEDHDLLVVNKSAGIVVHPGAGNRSGTLLNGLLFHEKSLSQVPGGGLVHRLDKGTTGLMVVAKNLETQAHLVSQLQARTVKRIYEAVVIGKPNLPGKIDAPIGRHKVQRTKMTVRHDGRSAITRYKILRYFAAHSYLELRLETGRTHQIRVHMQHLGFPLLGDGAYGGHNRILIGSEVAEQEFLDQFSRPALHAKKLSLVHPTLNEEVGWEVDTPSDMVGLLLCLGDHQSRTEI
ncbi:MAG: 23S rRNA pseudouridine(1911/1915/1917) synthase RluD [Gammaproteobacteria bacterium]|uniref:Pseudouridine synthase n=1 Tax=OM182 bacterium TaxID=2510334 RepID=A0A520RXH4_9GAMM|nr:23S rRNA pseudouridine(1911/1915/1917) synthase RluD [Gammaproteobacteria bacterium]OUV66939.1 MAG: 23S rRNA pseudouridine(1911/1915/1917) synthase [Gammaproteobacteria bacterium TMED133]RZO74867.1 MAG: 23S rRNA pseudouridine(1911/1915/1917) synthase RluD [OM182 bacterium]